jgi:hypothetical protein
MLEDKAVRREEDVWVGASSRGVAGERISLAVGEAVMTVPNSLGIILMLITG